MVGVRPLRTLTGDGFVERLVAAGPLVRVTHQLAPPGVEVAGRVAGLVGWLEENVGALLTGRWAPGGPDGAMGDGGSESRAHAEQA